MPAVLDPPCSRGGPALPQPASPGSGATRRTFLATSAVAVAGAAIAPSVHAAGGDVLRVGLIGCGGRGTGAALNALRADKNVKLTAVADVFKDKWQASL